MRITTLLLLVFCIHACKENAQEKESEFELNKPEAGDLYRGFHLGGGLCVYKYDGRLDGSPPSIIIGNCYDSLPADTTAPTRNLVKYKQGGLCFYHDCVTGPEWSFTVFMNVPSGFIDSNKNLRLNIFASRYNYPTMLYKYRRINPWILSYKKYRPTPIFSKEYDDFWEEMFSMAKPLKIKNEDFSDKCNSKFCSTKDFLEPMYEII